MMCRETSAEIPYWWYIATQIWVMLLIGWSKFSANKKHFPDLGSVKSSLRNFCTHLSDVIRETSSGITKCELFSEAKRSCKKTVIEWSLLFFFYETLGQTTSCPEAVYSALVQAAAEEEISQVNNKSYFQGLCFASLLLKWTGRRDPGCEIWWVKFFVVTVQKKAY